MRGNTPPIHRAGERGNVLLYILVAVVLLGLLTAALQGSDSLFEDVDREGNVIKATQVSRYGQELERAVRYVLDNGASESEIRFAFASAPSEYGSTATTPTFQVFSSTGGMARYRPPPANVAAVAQWDFYGHTAIPNVGSTLPDLVAVLGDVTEDFCGAVNQQLGLTAKPVDLAAGDTPDCVAGPVTSRFVGTFDSTPNTMDPASFTKTPMMQACVLCASDNKNYYYYVLMAR